MKSSKLIAHILVVLMTLQWTLQPIQLLQTAQEKKCCCGTKACFMKKTAAADDIICRLKTTTKKTLKQIEAASFKMKKMLTRKKCQSENSLNLFSNNQTPIDIPIRMTLQMLAMITFYQPLALSNQYETPSYSLQKPPG